MDLLPILAMSMSRSAKVVVSSGNVDQSTADDTRISGVFLKPYSFSDLIKFIGTAT